MVDGGGEPENPCLGSTTGCRETFGIIERHEIKYPYSFRAVCSFGYRRMRKSGVGLAFTFSVDTVCFVDASSLKIDRQ